jgi:hypothetical protein
VIALKGLLAIVIVLAAVVAVCFLVIWAVAAPPRR